MGALQPAVLEGVMMGVHLKRMIVLMSQWRAQKGQEVMRVADLHTSGIEESVTRMKILGSRQGDERRERRKWRRRRKRRGRSPIRRDGKRRISQERKRRKTVARSGSRGLKNVRREDRRTLGRAVHPRRIFTKPPARSRSSWSWYDMPKDIRDVWQPGCFVWWRRRSGSRRGRSLRRARLWKKLLQQLTCTSWRC